MTLNLLYYAFNKFANGVNFTSRRGLEAFLSAPPNREEFETLFNKSYLTVNKESLAIYQTKKGKDVFDSYCEVCECTPCDCDWGN